ncbi:CcmD family protein [Sphingobacterium sp. Mn56C]|uniref:CcmD family protein n=1 Tax=Sphingobacterium sp. Mn56C TaxID=3395261 RepID=UPI003BE21541
MKKIILSILITLVSGISAFAQADNSIEMATGLRSSGKIWVVVLVLLTIMVGLFLYLFSIDRRIKKLENK